MQNYLIKKRIYIVMLISVICFLALIVRMAFITFGLSDFINQKAYEQWTRDIPVNNGRGKIYDRNGELIVGNKMALTLASINRQVSNKEDAAVKIATILDTDSEKILKHLNKKNSIEMIKPEGRKLSLAKAKAIMNLDIDGIYLATDASRYYPYSDMLGQTLGFTNIDNDGLTGLELTYNNYLQEKDGALKIFTDAKGNLMKNMVSYYNEAASGMDIHLTIDVKINQILDNIVKNAANKYEPESIIAGVMHAKTGEILGISQYPFYNIENYQAYDQEVYNRNFLSWKSFEPGSTFKIVTYSAALNEGLFQLSETFNCGGSLSIGGHNIRCWKRQGHGVQTYLEGIQNSCNIAFMRLGERLGKEKLMAYTRAFGFGSKTDIDLMGEATGILFKESTMGPTELATASFGQGNSATPIQLMQAMSSVINDGAVTKPKVLKYVSDSLDNILYENKSEVKRQVISKETSSIMRYALEMVSAKGTGRNAFRNGYLIGGKTGTSQIALPSGGYATDRYILSYLGAAPMNDPEVIVYIAIEHPKNTVQYGGVVAAPLAGDIFENILPYLKVKQNYSAEIKKEHRYYIDDNYFTVEDYIGMMKKAILPTSNYNYLYLGTGTKVISQSPSKGSLIKEGSTIILYLG